MSEKTDDTKRIGKIAFKSSNPTKLNELIKKLIVDKSKRYLFSFLSSNFAYRPKNKMPKKVNIDGLIKTAKNIIELKSIVKPFFGFVVFTIYPIKGTHNIKKT